MRHLRALVASLVLALLVVPATAAGKVWVVGPAGAPGVDFATLQEAVNASTDGDLILVRPGASSGDTFVDRYVAIVGDNGGAPVALTGQLSMRKPAPGAPQLVRGLEVHNGFQAALEYTGAGTFGGVSWIEDCAFVGSDASQCCGYGVFADAIVGSPTGLLAATRARFAGAGSDAGGALSAAHVALWDSSCEGGDAGTTASGIGLDGGEGFRVLSGTLFASGCQFVGGDGGAGTCGTSFAGGGDGGSALRTEVPAEFVDCQFLPGAGGAAPAPCGPGAAGLTIEPPTAPVVHHPGSARSLELAAPVREGQTLAGSLSGEPGELALVAWSLGTANVPMGSLVGVLVLAPPVQVVAMGVVPPSGTLPIAATVQELGAGVEFAVIYFQSAFCSPATASCVLGSPSAAVLLDSAF